MGNDELSPQERTIWRKFDRIAALGEPVLFALGDRSNPDYYGRMAERAVAIFPDITLEVFAERHHFDPPHRIEPERTARVLQTLWRRASALAPR